MELCIFTHTKISGTDQNYYKLHYCQILKVINYLDY